MTEKETAFTWTCPKCGVKWAFPTPNAAVDAKPEATDIEDLQEILGSSDVSITDKGNCYEIRPNNYLGDAFGELHKKLKAAGGKWVSNKTDKTKSHWEVPKKT